MERRLEYHPRLYLGDSISKAKLDKIKKRLEKNPLLSNVFLITLSRNPSDQLEIIQAGQLVQGYYSKYPVTVAGIASSYDEAVEMIGKIAQECLQIRGDCALKEYLLC